MLRCGSAMVVGGAGRIPACGTRAGPLHHPPPLRPRTATLLSARCPCPGPGFRVLVPANPHSERLLNLARFPHAGLRPPPTTTIAPRHRNIALRWVSRSGVPLPRPCPSQPSHRETVKPNALSARRSASFTTHHHCASSPQHCSPLGVPVRRPAPASVSQPTFTPRNC